MFNSKNVRINQLLKIEQKRKTNFFSTEQKQYIDKYLRIVLFVIISFLILKKKCRYNVRRRYKIQK